MNFPQLVFLIGIFLSPASQARDTADYLEVCGLGTKVVLKENQISLHFKDASVTNHSRFGDESKQKSTEILIWHEMSDRIAAMTALPLSVHIQSADLYHAPAYVCVALHATNVQGIFISHLGCSFKSVELAKKDVEDQLQQEELNQTAQ